jgi:hypothetical protein
MAIASNTGAEHKVVKPQKIVDLATGMLEQELTIPNLFQKEGVDDFRGTENDTYNVKVEGTLPFHDYEFRSGSAGSSTPGVRQKIQFDLYEERTYPVSFQGRVYNGVAITDEQADFDLARWGKLLAPQVKAIARGLQRRAVTKLRTNSYPVVIGDAAANLRGALIEARRVLNKLNVPTEGRYLIIGTDVEAILLSTPTLVDAMHVADSRAESALADATLGRLMGFTIVVDQTIGSDEAFAFADNGFIFLNAAPSIPASKAAQGATQSLDGIALRWLQDYDTDYFTDRSVLDTYCGFSEVKDVLVGWNPAGEREVVSGYEHFVKGIQIKLDGASVYPTLPVGFDPNDAADWTAITTGTGGFIDKTKVSQSEELAIITGLTGPGKHLLAPVAATSELPTGTIAND